MYRKMLKKQQKNVGKSKKADLSKKMLKNAGKHNKMPKNKDYNQKTQNLPLLHYRVFPRVLLIRKNEVLT